MLPSNIFLSLIEYKIDWFSNFSHSFGANFLGSKDPTPPAIITLGVEKVFPAFVFTNQISFSFLTSSTLSLRCIGILKALIWFIKLFVNSSPVHSGTAGISYIGLSG